MRVTRRVVAGSPPCDAGRHCPWSRQASSAWSSEPPRAGWSWGPRSPARGTVRPVPPSPRTVAAPVVPRRPVGSPTGRGVARTVPAPADPVGRVPAVRPVGRVVRGVRRLSGLRRRPRRPLRVSPRGPPLRRRPLPVRPRARRFRVRVDPRHRRRPPLRDRRLRPLPDPVRAVVPDGRTVQEEGRRECSSSDRVAHSPPTRCRTRRGALDGPTRRNGHGYPPDAVTAPDGRPPSVVLAGRTVLLGVVPTEHRTSAPSGRRWRDVPSGCGPRNGAGGAARPAGAGSAPAGGRRRAPAVPAGQRRRTGRPLGRAPPTAPRAGGGDRPAHLPPDPERQSVAGTHGPGARTSEGPSPRPPMDLTTQVNDRSTTRSGGGPTTEKTTSATRGEVTVVGVTQDGDRPERLVRGSR